MITQLCLRLTFAWEGLPLTRKVHQIPHFTGDLNTSKQMRSYPLGGGSLKIHWCVLFKNRSRWPRGLRSRSAAARLLGLRVRIPPVAWMFVCCECWILSCTGLCDGPIPLPGEPYRVCEMFHWVWSGARSQTMQRWKQRKKVYNSVTLSIANVM